MDLIQAHGLAMTEFDRRVRKIAPEQWALGTPCREWSVRDLVGHLVYEQLWAPELLAGCTVSQVGDRFDHDNLGDNPLVSWVVAAAAAREAWLEPDALAKPVHVSSGMIDAAEYCWQMTTDLAVHTWDLARSIGADETLDPGAGLDRARVRVAADRRVDRFFDVRLTGTGRRGRRRPNTTDRTTGT